ncbi:MAG: DUF748 domain-containing protein, partial [Herbaspirillum sp.]
MTPLRDTITSFGTRHRHRLTLFASIFVGLVVVIALLGFLAAPWVVKSFVADKIGAEIGRKLEFGAVQINPFTLTAKLNQVVLYEPDRQHKMLTVGEVYLNASAASLFRLAPVISEIRIQQPVVHLIRVSESRFNFSDIVDKILAKPNTGTSHFSLNNIHLSGGQIDYDDQFRKSHHSLSEIDLAIPFLSNLKRRVDIFTKPAFSAKLDGSPFAISGKTRPFAETRDTTLQIDLDALSLPEFMALVPVALDFKLKSGLLDTRLNVDFHENADIGSVVVSGTAAVRDLQLQDQAGAPLLEWKKLSFELARIEPLNQLVRISALKLDAPQLHASRAKDGSINLLRAFTLPTNSASTASPNTAAAEPKKSKPFAFAMTQANITNGQLYWQDKAANDVTLHVKQLDAKLNNFNTD